jgi:hypothetical protein
MLLIVGRRTEGYVVDDLYRGKESWWLPEQHRLRAELLLLEPGAEVEAEDTLKQALALALSQKSLSLALRVATSLARLLKRQGRTNEGQELLARCYEGFGEGLNTPDLVEARTRSAERVTAQSTARQRGDFGLHHGCLSRSSRSFNTARVRSRAGRDHCSPAAAGCPPQGPPHAHLGGGLVIRPGGRAKSSQRTGPTIGPQSSPVICPRQLGEPAAFEFAVR